MAYFTDEVLINQRVVVGESPNYDEFSTKVLFSTASGLRATVNYAETDENSFKIYVRGERVYGLSAFVAWMVYKNGEIPDLTEYVKTGVSESPGPFEKSK